MLTFRASQIAFLLALFVYFVPIPLAQQADNCQMRQVIVGVRDTRRGSLVPGLTTSYFRATLKKKPIKVFSVDLQNRFPRLILLLDVSGSMVKPDKWLVASHVAEDLVSRAPPNAQIALATFSESIKESLEFSSGRDAVMRKLGDLRDQSKTERKGRTAILDTLATAVNWFGEPHPADAIFVITDGGENRSSAHIKTLQDLLLTHGVRFFAFLMRTDFDSYMEVGPDAFQSLAKKTGGMVLNYRALPSSLTYVSEDWPAGPKALEVLAAAAHIISDQIQNYYSLQMELPATISKKSKWTLELAGADGQKRRDSDIIYPHEFLPCAQGLLKP